ncbi:MAG: hypothetical protein ACYTJ0_00940 [Planctomycetota bacterium]|jgi:hypothetical protein
MHWTALLARRSFPADARVVDDLACMGCGYNLRGLAASGRCPECALPVAESLYLVREPGAVAAALQATAYSYLSIVVAVLAGVGAVLTGSRGLPWIAFGFAAMGSLVRLIATADLRRRAGLERLPLVGPRLNAALLVAALEAILATAALVGAFLMMKQPPPARLVQNLAGLSVAAWPLVMVVGMVQSSRFGGLLADLLDYGFVERELRIHRVLLLGGLAIGLAIVLAGRTLPPPAGTTLEFVGSAVGLVATAVGLGFLVVGVLHLAGAAQRATETREDVLETAPPPGMAPAPPPRAQPGPADLPDIALEPEDDADR